jgi:creatinine amidohydrolase
VTWTRWAEASTTAVADMLTRDPIVLFPLGALEAHGPHLANGTDSVIAGAVADRAAELLSERGVDVLVLPVLPLAVCRAARPFAGTIDVPSELVSQLIEAICAEVVRHGGRRFCLHAHHWDPPHLAAVDTAVERIRALPGVSCCVFDRRSLDDVDVAERFAEGTGTGIRHGGRVETSVVLHAEPEHVDEAAMARLAPVWVDLMAAMRAGATDFAEAGGADGYFGDPAAATRAEGERMVDYLGRRVADTARALEPSSDDPTAR